MSCPRHADGRPGEQPLCPGEQRAGVCNAQRCLAGVVVVLQLNLRAAFPEHVLGLVVALSAAFKGGLGEAVPILRIAGGIAAVVAHCGFPVFPVEIVIGVMAAANLQAAGIVVCAGAAALYIPRGPAMSVFSLLLPRNSEGLRKKRIGKLDAIGDVLARTGGQRGGNVRPGLHPYGAACAVPSTVS